MAVGSKVDVKVVQPDMFGGADEVIRPRVKSVVDSVARLMELSRSDMVRVSPERYAYIPAAHCKTVPEFCLARWVKDRAGEYNLLPMSGNWVRMTSKVAALMGWREVDRSCSYETLKRLGVAGFIEFVHVAPGTHLIEIGSWFRHLAECQDNPEMWERGSSDRETYAEANGLGGWKSKI